MPFRFTKTIYIDIRKEKQSRHHTDRLTKTSSDPELERRNTVPTENIIKKVDGDKKSSRPQTMEMNTQEINKQKPVTEEGKIVNKWNVIQTV